MSGPKRTPINRSRKPSDLINDEAVALFKRLEQVPVRHRMGYAYREHDHRLAKMLGLWSEHFLDGCAVNDPALFLHPPEYDFRVVSWERVVATRKQLLELAGLPPDGSHPVPAYHVDYDYDDRADFGDLAATPVKRRRLV
jgi:hypothetical protein